MKLPLVKRLKKRQHVQIAVLQDIVVEIIYKLVDKPVLHGGTAIWRCYGGNRFSEDLDFYFKPGPDFEGRFREELGSLGIEITKFKNTGNLIFCKISDGESEIRFESNLIKFKDSVIREYERTDGSLMTILTLSPELLIKEKMRAYLGRRFIRDVHDIYHLSSLADPEKIRDQVKELLIRIKPPVDENLLKVLIISGTIPKFGQMLQTIKARFLL